MRIFDVWDDVYLIILRWLFWEAFNEYFVGILGFSEVSVNLGYLGVIQLKSFRKSKTNI